MQLLILLFSCFLINFIKAEPLANPDVVIIPRDQEPGDDLARVYDNQISSKDDLNMPSKTIVISGVNEQMAREQPQHVMQAVVDAVHSQFQQDANKVENLTEQEIPELIVSEPEREIKVDQNQQQMRQNVPIIRPSNEVIQRVYRLPVVTRMILREEDNGKNAQLVKNKIPQWRSPLFFLHNNCPHSMGNKDMRKSVSLYPKRLLINQKKAFKHHHKNIPLMTLPSIEPNTPIFIRQLPNIKAIEQNECETGDGVVKPTMIMAMSRRTIEPEQDLQALNNFNGIIPNSMIISIMRRHFNEQEPKPPMNPLVGLLSKLVKKSFKALTSEEKAEKPSINYNINLNLTINNNNYHNDKNDNNIENSLVKSHVPLPFPFPNLLPRIEKAFAGQF